MGAFDNFEIPLKFLPVSAARRKKLAKAQWQTKDLGPYCANIRVTDGGMLEILEFETEKQPMMPGMGSLRVLTPINKRWEPLPFTGTANFYALLPVVRTPFGTAEDEWTEFCATFKEGKLASVVEIENALGL